MWTYFSLLSYFLWSSVGKRRSMSCAVKKNVAEVDKGGYVRDSNKYMHTYIQCY